MIKKLKFKNLYSFKEELIIDFIKKDKLRESEKYVFDDFFQNSYLKFLTIYGKNNVGKTNLFKGIKSFYSFVGGNSSVNFRPLKDLYLEWSNFNSNDDPIEYEIIFTILNKNDKSNFKEYRYGFSFNQEEIITEYLFLKENNKKKEYKVFEKNPENKNFIKKIVGDKFESTPGLFVNLPKNKLLLPIAANVGEKNCLSVVNSIFNKNININLDSSNLIFDSLLLQKLEQKQIESIGNFIHDIDISIDKIILKEENFSEQNNINNNPFINNPFLNPNFNQNTKIKKPYFIAQGKERPLSTISLGSKKIINYFVLIIDMINHYLKIQNNSNKNISNESFQNFLILIDEFDSGLHPKIIEPLVKEMLSKIKELGFEANIQLVFITHNPLFLGTNDLRRDQVIFIEKDKNYNSYIVELGNKSVRKDMNLSKAYIEGKLGGDPKIKYIEKEELDKIIKSRIKDALKDNKDFNKIMEKLANS